MRVPANNPARAQRASVLSWLAPTDGWISNYNIAAEGTAKNAATVLDNWWPTPQCVVMRRGSQLYYQIANELNPVDTLMTYDSGSDQRMFACTASGKIWDVSAASTAFLAHDLGVTSTPWSYTQFATAGGVFLVAVNGTNQMRLFDGTRWWPIGNSDILAIPFGAVIGTFAVGDTVTGGSSSATGTILYADAQMLYVTATSTATFTAGETVTGAKGGSASTAAASSTYWAGIRPASGSSIANVDTASFSFVWAYQARLYFVQKDSQTMWYLGADSVGGSISPFPMGGVFAGGGALMLGASWSLENSGQGGLSEQCVIVSNDGEVAVYQGIDPNLATSWSKVGLYRIDKPRGPRGFIRMGGDLLIATDTGVIPLSQAINKSLATLAPASVSYPIENDWDSYVSSRPSRDWQMQAWPENQMLATALPHIDGTEDVFFVANTRTGAWARFTGWDARALAVFQGQLYFGGANGMVVAAWQTGADMGLPYTCTWVPLFSDAGAPAQSKMPKDARLSIRGSYQVMSQLGMQYDYVLDLPPAPSASPSGSGDLWGVGTWGRALWSNTASLQVQRLWSPVAGMGMAVAPCVQITSGALVPFDSQLIRVDVTLVAGQLLS